MALWLGLVVLTPGYAQTWRKNLPTRSIPERQKPTGDTEAGAEEASTAVDIEQKLPNPPPPAPKQPFIPPAYAPFARPDDFPAIPRAFYAQSALASGEIARLSRLTWTQAGRLIDLRLLQSDGLATSLKRSEITELQAQQTTIASENVAVLGGLFPVVEKTSVNDVPYRIAELVRLDSIKGVLFPLQVSNALDISGVVRLTTADSNGISDSSQLSAQRWRFTVVEKLDIAEFVKRSGQPQWSNLLQGDVYMLHQTVARRDVAAEDADSIASDRVKAANFQRNILYYSPYLGGVLPCCAEDGETVIQQFMTRATTR